jgi:4-hydroxy-tetrahydrodipicolinate reductase
VISIHKLLQVDAPSGTAMGIADSICTGIKRNIKEDLVYGREGQVGKRSKKEIGVHALRMVRPHRVHTMSSSGSAEARVAQRTLFLHWRRQADWRCG